MVSLAIWNRVMEISTIVIAILVVSSSFQLLVLFFYSFPPLNSQNLVEKCGH